jgi:citrate lyase subunit beta/citryl-CoA lyase
MNNTIATAGNKGEKDRSDCFVSLELTSSGGIVIDLTSKVEVLFGNAIRTLCQSVLKHFGIDNAHLIIEDKGALPFVMAARLEAAIMQLVETDKQYLPEMLPENQYASARDQHRISRLYLPGNTPSLMINAGIHSPSAIILDLEDGVAVHKKHEARYLVRNALRNVSFMGVERIVRINQVPAGLDELDFCIPHHVNTVVVPKCESPDQVLAVNERIEMLRQEHGITQPVWLIPIVESALGVIKSFEIAQASANVVALAIGLEDYTADLGISRTNEGRETLFARCQVINACKAAGIQALDSVFSDVGDMEALKTYVLQSKSLGFDGVGCIHPRQLKIIHEFSAPGELELEKAKKIVIAFHEATEKGLGVVSLGTKMIDAPVVKRAQRTIDLAISLGRLPSDWKDSDHRKNEQS